MIKVIIKPTIALGVLLMLQSTVSYASECSPNSTDDKDCFISYPQLIPGGVTEVKISSGIVVPIINNVKYGYHCGKGRGSNLRPMNKVDAACRNHDKSGGGKAPGNGRSLDRFCSLQRKFVYELEKLDSRFCSRRHRSSNTVRGCQNLSRGSRLRGNQLRAQQMLLAQFSVERMGICAIGGRYEKGAKTIAKIFTGNVSSSNKKWRVDIDSCHRDLNGTGTKNSITVEFFSGSKRVGSRTKKGVSDHCNTKDAKFTYKTNKSITHVVVSTSGTDAFFIDELYLYKGSKQKQRHGRDNGRGWCLSKDSNDAKSWRKKSGKCRSRFTFKY